MAVQGRLEGAGQNKGSQLRLVRFRMMLMSVLFGCGGRVIVEAEMAVRWWKEIGG